MIVKEDTKQGIVAMNVKLIVLLHTDMRYGVTLLLIIHDDYQCYGGFVVNQSRRHRVLNVLGTVEFH